MRLKSNNSFYYKAKSLFLPDRQSLCPACAMKEQPFEYNACFCDRFQRSIQSDIQLIPQTFLMFHRSK